MVLGMDCVIVSNHCFIIPVDAAAGMRHDYHAFIHATGYSPVEQAKIAT
jgi:hypothetical protein